MKSLKKMASATLLAAGVLFSSAFNANAALIEQLIGADFGGGLGVIGSIEIEFDDALIGTGVIDSAFDGEPLLVELNIFGGTDFVFFDFQVAIDTDNLINGIEFLAFDAEEVNFDDWTYQLLFDLFDPAGNFLDIFQPTGFVGFTQTLALGPPTITLTPNPVNAPATLAIFALAGLGFAASRKRS